ncbi:MAG: ABC transporter ATP-binding protein, partial [Alphaproteobacteria bacterium]|nr:ABC transporter ATP-binding protein [Alphaproteobacteria bacterium]
MAANALVLDQVVAGYGEAIVLDGLSLAIGEGTSLALLGRNGAGKTTLLNTVVGLTTLRRGRIVVAGVDIAQLRPDQRAGAGIGWVPQERNIFRSLTVEENMSAVARPGPWTIGRLNALFPRLAERKGNLGSELSGGEQQMLAVARALALNPRVLLLDEPLEGLAPIVVQELLAALRAVVREEGMTTILVEQNARRILPVTDRVVVLERGNIVFQGDSAQLNHDP